MRRLFFSRAREARGRVFFSKAREARDFFEGA